MQAEWTSSISHHLLRTMHYTAANNCHYYYSVQFYDVPVHTILQVQLVGGTTAIKPHKQTLIHSTISVITHISNYCITTTTKILTSRSCTTTTNTMATMTVYNDFYDNCFTALFPGLTG